MAGFMGRMGGMGGGADGDGGFFGGARNRRNQNAFGGYGAQYRGYRRRGGVENEGHGTNNIGGDPDESDDEKNMTEEEKARKAEFELKWASGWLTWMLLAAMCYRRNPVDLDHLGTILAPDVLEEVNSMLEGGSSGAADWPGDKKS